MIIFLAPLGRAFFHFNMQFDYDDSDIKGDLEVKAEGTESLMANEVRSQRLMQFLGVVQNPVLAPFAKMDYIIREIAKSMDLDPDKLTNSMGDAAIQAEILKKFKADNPPEVDPNAPQQGAPAPKEQPPAGVQVQDTTGSGGGQVGTGTTPVPGEQGFTQPTQAKDKHELKANSKQSRNLGFTESRARSKTKPHTHTNGTNIKNRRLV